jgi:hypothetical protein
MDNMIRDGINDKGIGIHAKGSVCESSNMAWQALIFLTNSYGCIK